MFCNFGKKHFMKKFLLLIIISAFSLNHQNLAYAQAGIFKVRLMVDKILTSSVMVTAGNQTANTFSSFRFPSNLQDSIKSDIQKTVQKQLFQNATYIYDIKADGTQRKTIETGTFAGGYPKMTKKRAMFSYEQEIYVKVKIKVQGYKGPTFGAMGVQYSNIHPTVKFKLKAFDSEKKKIYSRKIRLWDFDKVRSISFTNQFSTVTNTNALNPQQVYDMIHHTLMVFNEETEKNR
jgi:hypothetical protein